VPYAIENHTFARAATPNRVALYIGTDCHDSLWAGVDGIADEVSDLAPGESREFHRLPWSGATHTGPIVVRRMAERTDTGILHGPYPACNVPGCPEPAYHLHGKRCAPHTFSPQLSGEPLPLRGRFTCGECAHRWNAGHQPVKCPRCDSPIAARL
jgi:hypothetical protein